MSMPLPPPDTRAPGQTGHIADHNTISDALAALETAVQGLENDLDGVGIQLPAGDLGGTAAGPLVVKIQGTPINASPGGDTAFLRADGTWDVPPGTGGGGGGGDGDGTVTSVSGATANGFVVSVNEETTTPEVTVSTSVVGVAKGVGGALAAAVAGVDFLLPGGSGADLTDITATQVGADPSGAAAAAQAASALRANNLSDLASAPTARANLGLGSAATQSASAFDGAGAASAAQAASLALPAGGTYPGGTTTFLRSDGHWASAGGGGGGALIQPTGSHAGDAAAISAVLSTVIANTYGGTVDMAAGTWHLNPGDIAAITRSGIYFRWQPGSAIICTGSGDVIRMYDSTAYGGGRAINGGGILGSPTFITPAMTGAWSAVHIGDILGPQVYVNVYNVGGTANDKGIWWDNQYYWTEQAEGDIRATSCGVTYDNSANISGQATGSFYRGEIGQYSISNGNCDCISMINGALLNYGHYTLRGNVSTSSAQYWTIKLTGSSAGTTDAIWEVGVELDDNVATAPGTIFFASGGNAFEGEGLLNWAGYPMTASNNGGQFNFKGKVVGDDNLPQLLSAGEYAQTVGNGSTFFSGVASFIVASASGAVTGLIMAPGFERGQSCIVANAAGGSLTFAASGTSNVAQGTGAVIPAGASREFRWSEAKSLWY
jgi:hypothetical protein